MSNMPQELKDSVPLPLKIPQDDAELQQHVAAFIATAGTPDAPAVAPSPAPDAPPRVTIPPDTAHLADPAPDQFLTEALVDEKKIEITAEEKDLFVKAMLTDAPFKLTVKLFGGKLVAEMRSRSHYEQKRIFDLVNLDLREGKIKETDLAMMVSRSQEYCAGLMIERWNGKLFSEIVLKPGTSLEEDAKVMRQFYHDKVEAPGMLQWNAMLNAMRIFETKCAELSTMAANADFWTPRATG